MFQFLGTPPKDKKHVVYDGGHGAFPVPRLYGRPLTGSTSISAQCVPKSVGGQSNIGLASCRM